MVAATLQAGRNKANEKGWLLLRIITYSGNGNCCRRCADMTTLHEHCVLAYMYISLFLFLFSLHFKGKQRIRVNVTQHKLLDSDFIVFW